MRLKKNIKLILDILLENGQGYIVGGYVRDILLGVEPKDCDFVTDIGYDRLIEIFKDYSPKEIGKHFGIIQIKIDGIQYEIAKMRQDIGVPQDRREQRIEFTKNIYEDLKRRDFTINAIAFDGESIYYGDSNSRYDIKSKTLRFVGESSKRVEEDPLRILRYFRFLATKDLKPLDEDIEKLSAHRELLENLSVERIREELNKIILGENAYDILKLLYDKKILEIIIPECKEIDESLLQGLKDTGKDSIVRLAILFYSIRRNKSLSADEKVPKEIMERLRYDKNSIERVYTIIKYHTISEVKDEEKFVKEMMNRLEKSDMERYFLVLRAGIKVKRESYILEQIERLEKKYQKIVEKQLPISIRDLDISGKELLENGFTQGKILGETLKYLLDQVLEASEYNTQEQLLKLALEYKKGRE